MASSSRPSTVQDLLRTLQSIEPDYKPLPGYENKKCNRSFGTGVDMDECYPGIYIGDGGSAKSKECLKMVGITHVLNTAQGNKFAMVDTEADFYNDVGINYKGLRLLDVPSANIAQYFEDGANFIEDALSNGGKVLVHCFMGISRSATITCAFLMLRRNMGAAEALASLRKNRCICPNDGFLAQLADLDNRLKAERGQL